MTYKANTFTETAADIADEMEEQKSSFLDLVFALGTDTIYLAETLTNAKQSLLAFELDDATDQKTQIRIRKINKMHTDATDRRYALFEVLEQLERDYSFMFRKIDEDILEIIELDQ